MLYSLEAVRASIRNREGKRVFYLGKGDQLTSQARDFLSRERIEILPADRAKPDEYRLLGGGIVTEKPEHMTHLHGNVLVPKTHPRIAFRGAVDTLEAELLLAQCVLCKPYDGQVGEILEFARRLIRCDVLDEPVGEEKLCGLTEQELRTRSHRPQEFYGQPHFMPNAGDGEALLRVNRARCAARTAELAAVEAFSEREGNPTRPDILKAMNRLSSMVKDMDRRGKVVNTAFAVSAAFVFGDHLGFTAGFAPEMLPAVILGKLAGGVAAVGVALVLTRKEM